MNSRGLLLSVTLVLLMMSQLEAAPGYPSSLSPKSRIQRQCTYGPYCIVNGQTVLSVGDTYVSPDDPCAVFRCQADGEMRLESVVCEVVSECPDGSPPILPPGECCPSCIFRFP